MITDEQILELARKLHRPETDTLEYRGSYDEMKKTPWFLGVTPVHVGVYQVKDYYNDFVWFSYWDERGFGYRSCIGAGTAYIKRYTRTLLPPTVRQWRGVLK